MSGYPDTYINTGVAAYRDIESRPGGDWCPRMSESTIRRIPWIDWPSCDPTILGKRVDGDRAITTLYHCRRLSCDNCGPVLSTFRAKNLLSKLQADETESVWFGVVDKAAITSIQRFAHRNEGIKRLTTLYFDDPDLRTVLATVNVVPRRPLLIELPTEIAVIDRWFRYAIDHKLRKNPHDDWNITDHRWVDWVDDGPKWDMVETDQRMDRIHGYVPNTPIGDTEEYKQRFRRIRSSITNPPEATYLD